VKTSFFVAVDVPTGVQLVETPRSSSGKRMTECGIL
jgi:hypothetical protein